MSIDRTYYCEGPDDNEEGRCMKHVRTATPPPYLPSPVIEVRQNTEMDPELHHFCGWDCLMKYAAKFPPPEVIPMGELPDAD